MNPAIAFVIGAFRDWISLFTAPLQNWGMLWIIIPVYLGWAFTEFYQEKKGTSYGNAISNGIIVLWVGIDWARTTFNIMQEKGFGLDSVLLTKLFISALMFAYGLLIITHAIKAKKASFYIGKIRLVTYIIVMFTPIFYDAVHLTFSVLLAVILFFPLFYIFIEILDFLIPDPKALREDLGENSADEGFKGFQASGYPAQSYQNQIPKQYPYQRYPQYQNYPQYYQQNYQQGKRL